MNLTCYLHEGKHYVIDCGIRFSEPVKLGTDAVVPKVDQFFEQVGGVDAYIITHGHEDHIGALPYIVERWPAPIYATPWAANLLSRKFARRGMDEDDYPISIVEAGDRVRDDSIEIEYLHVNHSIPHACALVIRTRELTVFHTGDFKFDATPIREAPIDLEYLSQLGENGIDLVLADSTNADKSGYCPSERTVEAPLTRLLTSAQGAVFLSTFSSNLWRLITIFEACQAANRRVFVQGTGIAISLEIAKETGVYEPPPGVLVDAAEVGSLDRRDFVVLATGCQGEWRAAMSRISHGEHRDISVESGDTVILSARIIPGNERSIFAMIDRFKRLGAYVITPKDEPEIHVSGHAYGGELQELIQRLQPKYYLPVHGAYTQMLANQQKERRKWSVGPAQFCNRERRYYRCLEARRGTDQRSFGGRGRVRRRRQPNLDALRCLARAPPYWRTWTGPCQRSLRLGARKMAV